MLSAGTLSAGSVYAITTRSAASSRVPIPYSRLEIRHIRRNRGDASHSPSQSFGHRSLPCSSGLVNTYASGRRAHRLAMNQIPVTPVSTPSRASRNWVLPDHSETTTLPSTMVER